MRLRMLQCTENKMLFDCDTLNICTVSDAQDAAIECCTTENGFSACGCSRWPVRSLCVCSCCVDCVLQGRSQNDHKLQDEWQERVGSCWVHVLRERQ